MCSQVTGDIPVGLINHSVVGILSDSFNHKFIQKTLLSILHMSEIVPGWVLVVGVHVYNHPVTSS